MLQAVYIDKDKLFLPLMCSSGRQTMGPHALCNCLPCCIFIIPLPNLNVMFLFQSSSQSLIIEYAH